MFPEKSTVADIALAKSTSLLSREFVEEAWCIDPELPL